MRVPLCSLALVALVLLAITAGGRAEDASASTSVERECPTEALRRIGLCQKILRTYYAPSRGFSDPQIVPHMKSWSSSAICNAVAKATPSNVDYGHCQLMAAHLYGVAGGTEAGMMYQNRATDIHDTCVRLLTRAFPVNTNKRWIDPSDFSNCSLKKTGGVTGVRCLFLHGMGSVRLQYKGDAARDGPYAASNTNDGWLASWPKYWAPEAALDGLCDARFYVTETTMRAWTDDATQKEYCAAVDRYQPHIVFTHSMGNMIVGAAIYRNLAGACQRINVAQQKDSIAWFSAQSPWIGSPAATSSREACEADKKGKGLKGLFTKIKNAVIRAVKPCEEKAALSLDPTVQVGTPNPSFAQLRATGNKHSAGSLCGVAAAPLTVGAAFSLSGLGLFLLQSSGAALGLVKWGADAKTSLPPARITGNDGLVPFGSCGFPEKVYTASPLNAYYTAEVSHQDGTCYIGADKPSLGASKQPCSWYVLRVSDVRKRLIGSGGLSPNVFPVARSSWYLPFDSYAYPKSFLEMGGWQSREQAQAMEDAAAAQAQAEAEENGSDRSALEASTQVAHQIVVPGPDEIALQAALAEVYGSAFVEMEAALKADAEAEGETESHVLTETESESAVDSEAEAEVEAEAEGEQSAASTIEQLESEVAELEAMLEDPSSSADEDRSE